MPRRTFVAYGAQRFRIAPKVGASKVAAVVVDPSGAIATKPGVEHLQRRLANMGFVGMVTGALRRGEAQGLIDAGLTVIDELTVLHLPLDDQRPVTSTVRLTTIRPWDMNRVLALDHAAFPIDWRLDRIALSDAFRATERSRGRYLSGPNGSIAAYAITGVTGSEGFLQRLAVHPDAQRQGLGTAMINDAIAWCSEIGCEQLLVNTQQSNITALNLYRSMGFIDQPEPMVVLQTEDLRDGLSTSPETYRGFE